MKIKVQKFPQCRDLGVMILLKAQPPDTSSIYTDPVALLQTLNLMEDIVTFIVVLYELRNQEAREQTLIGQRTWVQAMPV